VIRRAVSETEIRNEKESGSGSFEAGRFAKKQKTGLSQKGKYGYSPKQGVSAFSFLWTFERRKQRGK